MFTPNLACRNEGTSSGCEGWGYAGFMDEVAGDRGRGRGSK